MRIDQLKPGQVLYSVESGKLGNTNVRMVNVFKVKIATVAESAENGFTASWNGNTARLYYSVPKHWKAKKPVLVKSGLAWRRPTREERQGAILRDRGAFVEALPDGDKTLLPPAKCSWCRGTGWDRDQWRTCSVCGGRGQTRDAEQQAKREKRV